MDKGLFLPFQIQFMQKLLVVLAVALSCSLSLSAIGQQKTTPQKKASATKKAVQTPVADDIPPEVEKLEDSKIDNPSAEINFDTTAAIDDAFTKDILALLTLTGAFENDVKAAEQALKQNLGESNDPNAKVFYERFMYEMREGRARRWMTNLYVRTYRLNFTHSEIKEITQFYQTPLGKKFIEKTPLVAQAVMMQGQKIGAYLGQTIMAEILNNK